MKELQTDDPVYLRKVASQPPGQYSVTRLLVSINGETLSTLAVPC